MVDKRFPLRHCGKPEKHEPHNWNPVANSSGATFNTVVYCNGSEETYRLNQEAAEAYREVGRQPSVAELIAAPLEANEAYAALARKIDQLRDFIADLDNYHLYKPETVRVEDIKRILEGE